MELKDNWSINRHTHSTFEFHFVTAGSCSVSLDDCEFTVEAGEFYVTAPYVFHEQRGKPGERFVEYGLNCDIRLEWEKPSEAQHIIKVLTETHCKKLKDANGAIALFDMALEEAYHQNIGFFNNIKSLVVMIVNSAVRSIRQNASARYDVPLKNEKDDYRFAQIDKFINDNISHPISTHDIAKHLYLSDKQVCRIIKGARGMSTKQLIERVKFEKAEEMLNNTRLSVKQISDALGFSSQYYFNQFFKRMEGYPPSVYRSNIKSSLNTPVERGNIKIK